MLHSKQDLLSLVSKALGVEVNHDSSSENTPEWDSLGQLQLMQELDSETGGRSSDIDRIFTMTSVRELEEALRTANLLT